MSENFILSAIFPPNAFDMQIKSVFLSAKNVDGFFNTLRHFKAKGMKVIIFLWALHTHMKATHLTWIFVCFHIVWSITELLFFCIASNDSLLIRLDYKQSPLCVPVNVVTMLIWIWVGAWCIICVMAASSFQQNKDPITALQSAESV